MGSLKVSLYLDICDVIIYNLGYFRYGMTSKSYEYYKSIMRETQVLLAAQTDTSRVDSSRSW